LRAFAKLYRQPDEPKPEEAQMTFPRRHVKFLAVGAACAAAGAGASAIATAGAAGTSTANGSAKSAARHPVARRALERRAVQGDLVVATKSGFATVTFNRGFVQSVSGQQLTIREGTKKATYKTVTLTIPAGAKVRDNGKTASLSQLSAGQRVGVVQTPNRTLVIARDARP
jgi:hypothetical protein